MGPISDSWGRRPVYVVVLVIYVAASSGAAVAKQIWQLSMMIILQGFSDSSTLPLCMYQHYVLWHMLISLILYQTLR